MLLILLPPSVSLRSAHASGTFSKCVRTFSYQRPSAPFFCWMLDSRRPSASGLNYQRHKTLTFFCFSTSCQKAPLRSITAPALHSRRLELLGKKCRTKQTNLNSREENAQSWSEPFITWGQGHIRWPHHLKAVLSSCLGKLSEMSMDLFLSNRGTFFFFFFPGGAVWSKSKNQLLWSKDQLILFTWGRPPLSMVDSDWLAHLDFSRLH